jgi:hypothetical protein
MARSANLDFFAAEADQRAVLDFLFSSTDDFLLEANHTGDVVHLEVTPNDLVHLQVEW